MRVSVVVPTLNQAALLAACLPALASQRLARDEYEIIIVDDGSTDGTAGVVAAAAEDSQVASIRLIRFDTNRGRSAARNAGVAAAQAPLVGFVDSDVIVTGGFLSAHLEAQEHHGPGTLTRGPVVLIPNPEAAAETPVPRLAASPAYLDTANAVVEKAALVQAGLFDEGFPGYGWEDFDLGLRLKQQGVRRVFVRAAAAFHVQPPLHLGSLPGLLRKEEERARSAVYFYRKHPSLGTRLLIQATPLHRAAYWAQSLGGLLGPERAARAARWLERRGRSTIAYLLVRAAMNRHYLRTLIQELRHDPSLA